MKLLIQTQLSNIVNGKFDLACDSGWQMVMGRVREMLKLNPELHIDVMGPELEQLITLPNLINGDLWEKYSVYSGDFSEKRLGYIEHHIVPNALVTRYDFDWTGINATTIDLPPQRIGTKPKYDAVYVNDPIQLRALKAMFHLVGGYQPKFFVHSHFVDLPSVPKFPVEASLWLGQCEATIRADHNFWQCGSALEQFLHEMPLTFVQSVVDEVAAKSTPWDDGYSRSEITSPINESNLRFDVGEVNAKLQNKIVIFFPNRISPSSGDYTNGMKFMFKVLPELRCRRQDFVVVCGNPNLKFTNDELLERCGTNGYVKLHDFTFNRDEFKFIARRANIALGLYDKDTYGGTAARECVELGCCVMWLDNFEYSSLAREATCSGNMLTKADFSELVNDLCLLMDAVRRDGGIKNAQARLQDVVRRRCSYEETTPKAMRLMGLL